MLCLQVSQSILAQPCSSIPQFKYLSNSIATFLGREDGTFGSVINSSSMSVVHGLTVGDFNRDGVNDIISSSGSTSNLDLLLANTLQTNEIQLFNLTTQESSLQALDQIRTALEIERISKGQGTIGAFQSRLDVAQRTLRISEINTTNANSRIIDIDIAEESAMYVAATIRQQIAHHYFQKQT